MQRITFIHSALTRGGVFRSAVATMAAVAVASVALALVPTTARAQEPDPPFSGDVAPDGSSLLVAGDEDIAIEDLVDSLRDAGCNPVSIAMTEEGGWLIYIPGAPSFVNTEFPATVSSDSAFAVLCHPEEEDTEPTAQDAVDVVEEYFADIDAERYQEAYDAWEDGSNPQSYAEFVAGFADTESVSVEVGEPGRIDAGAGQRYIEIPVEITSMLDDGTEQHFEGTYTLHHTADIPGATAEQREWHIRSADIVEVD